jgi:hypothetical protein
MDNCQNVMDIEEAARAVDNLVAAMHQSPSDAGSSSESELPPEVHELQDYYLHGGDAEAPSLVYNVSPSPASQVIFYFPLLFFKLQNVSILHGVTALVKFLK